jgi:DNA-binding GntR family transcriptional regulator
LERNKSSMKSLRAYEILRDMILRGEKLPGSRLILFDLEEELNIGRGPVREALMKLERSGLVKNIPYKGAIVATPPTKKEIVHIYDLRIEVEVRLAVEAMEYLTNEDIAELEKRHSQMQEFPIDHHELDSRFHFVIYDASKLPHLCNIVRSLRFSVESVLNIHRRNKEHCKKFNKEHGLIIEAVKERDIEKLKLTMAQNIASGLEIINETYEKVMALPR